MQLCVLQGFKLTVRMQNSLLRLCLCKIRKSTTMHIYSPCIGIGGVSVSVCLVNTYMQLCVLIISQRKLFSHRLPGCLKLERLVRRSTGSPSNIDISFLASYKTHNFLQTHIENVMNLSS